MSTHEDFSRGQEVAGSSDRSFGLVFAAVFLLVGLWPLLDGESLRRWALAGGAAFLLLALLAPGVLHPLNRVWLWIGSVLHRVVFPVVAAVLFYLVLSPIAILARRFAKDPLRLQRLGSGASYWIRRDPPGPAPKSMINQF